MKIEYLQTDHRPLVRLFDFRTDAVNAMRTACTHLADGRMAEFVLHEQPWANPVNGCRFIWRATQKNVGVRRPAAHGPLLLEYTDEAWREIEGKLSSFVDARPGTFNWLTREGEVDVLISPDGNW